MPELPPPLRRQQRWFLFLAILVPTIMLVLFGWQALSLMDGAQNKDEFPLVLLLLGFFALIMLPVVISYWLSRRYYLKVASTEPMPDELFVAGCSNVVGASVQPELALAIRNTIEEKLMLSHGTLRPETNLAKFGTWAYFLYAPTVAEKFHVTVNDMDKASGNVRILAHFIHTIEVSMGSKEFVREEPGEKIPPTPSTLVSESDAAEHQQPLVLRDDKPFRRWAYNNAIAIPFCLFLGYLCSRGGIVGTVIAIVFLGTILFGTLVLGALFPTVTIDPHSRLVSIVRKFFGIVQVSKHERGFDAFSLVRVYDCPPNKESKTTQQSVCLIPTALEDNWILGDDSGKHGPYCDTKIAREISVMMHLPLEVVQHAPPPPLWLRRWMGGGKERDVQ